MSDNLRSKNSFSFESDDNKFPYQIPSGVPIGKRNHIVFNYSTTYFRRKLSGSNDLYFIDGGNIPEGMATSVTLESSTISPDDRTQTVTCSTLQGNATKIVPPTNYQTGITPYAVTNSTNPTVINLSPSTLVKLPRGCNDPPIQEEEILYEKAKQFKPNTLYNAVFQNSQSNHPRAKGFAVEDVYVCLKLINAGGNYNVKDNGTCCDYFGRAFGDGTGGNGGGAYILEDDYGSDPPTQSFTGRFGNTFNCADLSSSTFYCPEAGNRCHFGFYLDINSVGIMPEKVCKEIDGYSPMQAWYTITYLAAGNTDCGCAGFGGTVTLGSVMKCIQCSYIQSDGDPLNPRSTDWGECETDSTTGEAIICENIFNKKVSLGGKDIYFSTLATPSFKFPDGQRLELTDAGTLRPVGCGGNILLDCNDVN